MSAAFVPTRVAHACAALFFSAPIAAQTVPEPVPSQASAASSPESGAGPTATTLPPVVVFAHRDIGLRADHAPATTKGSTPLLRTPMSVQVIPQALIEDRQANVLREALQTISGVYPGATSLHEDIIVRGFYVDQSYRNGVRTMRFGPTELANAERIDVLKGPSSTQFGRGDISGMFNVITKKPQAESFLSIEQEVGSYRFSQTTLDSTGPLNEDRTLRYRVVGAYENAHSFRDYVKTDRRFVAPSLSWVPNADTRVNFEVELARHDSPIDRGVPGVNGRPADVPRHRNYSEPDAYHVNNASIFAFDWSHRFNDTWTLRQNFMIERGRGRGLEYQQARASDFFDPADPTYPGNDVATDLLRLPRRIERRDVNTEYTSFELAGTPVAGSMKHDLVVGVDVARVKRVFDFREPDFADIEIVPIYNYAPTGAAPATTLSSLDRTARARSWGVYAQDQIQIHRDINLLVGGRYDNAREKNDGADEGVHDKKFSPRVGMVYGFNPHASLYGSYTESFSSANADRTASGDPMKPITAKQWEVGFKAETANRWLFTTLALYDLTKRNIVVPDPADMANSVQLGQSRSRGLEWDVGGRLTAHWNLTASYSYTDAEVTHDTDASKVGRRLYGVPKHSAKGFFRYDEAAGGRTGWSLGGGLVALGTQWADIENTVAIPGYVRVDAMGAYKWVVDGRRMSVQMNVENLGDKTYHLPSGGASEIAFGRPRSVVAALRAEF